MLSPINLSSTLGVGPKTRQSLSYLMELSGNSIGLLICINKYDDSFSKVTKIAHAYYLVL